MSYLFAVFSYTHTHTHTFGLTYTCACAHTDRNTHKYEHTHTHTQTHTNTYKHRQARIHVRILTHGLASMLDYKFSKSGLTLGAAGYRAIFSGLLSQYLCRRVSVSQYLCRRVSVCLALSCICSLLPQMKAMRQHHF